MWNANPLHDIVPVDWAEVARALRTVWLRSLNRPSAAMAAVELNANLMRSAVEAWNDAGQRWWVSGAQGPFLREECLAERKAVAEERRWPDGSLAPVLALMLHRWCDAC
jgi:hypothetical protein